MSGSRWVKPFTLLAMCLGLFMPQLDTTVVNLALPSIQKSLQTNVGGLQWIVDSYNLTFASLLLTGGTLGDLFGRKRLFLIGLVLFTLGSLLCGLAFAFPFLIAGRVLQGVGAALELPGTLSIISTTYTDPKERARAISLWASVAGLALALGPTAGAFLVTTFGWQSIFFLNLPIGVVAFAIALGIVRESSHSEGRRVDVPGQLLAVLCLVALTYAVIEGQAQGWSSPLILGCLAFAVVCLLAFIVVERRTVGPMVPLEVFRRCTFSASLAIASMMTFGMYGMLFLISLYLQTMRRASPLLAGIQLLPLSIAFMLLSPAAGRWMNRFGPRWVMTLGMTLMGVGLLALTHLSSATGYGFLLLTMTVIGVGLGLNTGPVMTVAVGSVPAPRAGMASGLGNVARMIGATLGVALLGAIFAAHLSEGRGTVPFMAGLHLALFVGGCVELLGALLAATCIADAGASVSESTSQEQAPVSTHV